MRSAEVQPVLGAEGNSARAAAARGALLEHQTVAQQAPEGVLRPATDRGRDEAMRGPRQQRNLSTRRRAQRVGIAVAPVLVDERALAQVADARATPPQEGGEG